MKGLLIKDFKLLKGQTKFFLLILAIAAALALFYGEITFPIGFATFVTSAFASSTISYDEFENGNAFLFSLPISRKGYVMEKYGFGLILAAVTWAAITAFVVIVNIVKAAVISGDMIFTGFLVLPVSLVFLAVILPLQLKFGADKAKIAMIIGIGILYVAGLVLAETADKLAVSAAWVSEGLANLSEGVIAAFVIAAAAAALAISMEVSLTIVNRKEF